ncbi:hypothetical protein CK228_16385 [Mesorhizobium sp. WSM4312]|nr:hypothetical protein CK228_16385 [Mesorhizobium sp. WSM4312]
MVPILAVCVYWVLPEGWSHRSDLWHWLFPDKIGEFAVNVTNSTNATFTITNSTELFVCSPGAAGTKKRLETGIMNFLGKNLTVGPKGSATFQAKLANEQKWPSLAAPEENYLQMFIPAKPHLIAQEVILKRSLFSGDMQVEITGHPQFPPCSW